MSSPINVTWTGDSFEPANRFWATKCDQRFVVGQAYTLDEVHARSTATHAHYFAVLHDIWQSLPERMAEKFPTEEHLRKYALIRTGYRTETQHVCKTPAEAERLAAAIRPYDTYQIVTLNDVVVTVYNAVSQDMRSMDKQTFQKSKEAVLDFCSDLVGIDPVETRRLAGIPVSPSDEGSPPLSDVDGSPPAEDPSQPSGTPSPLPDGSSLSPETWLLNIARMLWAATSLGGDIAVLKNQKAASLIEFPKPEGCPERIAAKANSVFRQCVQVIELSIEPSDGLALIAGIVGVDQDDILRKAGS